MKNRTLIVAALVMVLLCVGLIFLGLRHENAGGGPGQNAGPEASGTQCHQVGEECAEEHLAFQGNAHDAGPLGHGVAHGAVDQGDALPHAGGEQRRQERGGQDRIHFSPPSFVCSGRR